MRRILNKLKLHKVTTGAIALFMVVCISVGILLPYIPDLFTLSKEDEETSFEEIVASDEVVVKHNQGDLLARPQGGKDTYDILEIVPDPVFSAFRYFIGGMEPDRELLVAMANKSGFQNIMGNANAQTPFLIVENGIKKEYLGEADKQNPDTYKKEVGTKQNNQYEIKREKVDMTGIDPTTTLCPGHFQYVGDGLGTYIINNLEYKVVPFIDGNYVPNYKMIQFNGTKYYDFYNASRLGQNGITTIPESMTGMNYDAYPELKKADKINTTEGYYPVSIAVDGKGEYVIDEEQTRLLLDAPLPDVSSTLPDTYPEKLAQEMSATVDYIDKKIVFRRYNPETDAPTVSGAGTVSGPSTTTVLNRYNLTFAYGDAKVAYGIKEYIFNPGKGDFCANLKKISEKYYHVKSTSETGEYENCIVNFDVNAKEGTGVWGRNWVWIEGANKNGKEYSTEAEYNSGKGVLWTPSFLADYHGFKAYYCKNDFKNNEWFKVACLTTGYKYDTNKTPSENLELAQPYIRAFERSTRIVINTVTPDQVTQDMIDKAEVVYISNNYVFENLGNAINAVKGTTTKPNFTTDLSQFTMAKSIYRECMNKSKAVMINVNVGQLAATSNLKKLYLLFTMYQNPHNMEFFLDNMRGYKDGFNCIDNNGNVVIRTTAQNGKNVYYSLDSEVAFVDSLVGMTPAQVAEKKRRRYYQRSPYIYENVFNTTRFEVLDGRSVDRDKKAKGFELGNDTNVWVDELGNKERYLLFHWYGSGFMQAITNMPKIHEILKQDTFGVYVTNSVMNSHWEDVIYVDEFDYEYRIYYMIESMHVLYEKPEVDKVEIYLDANSDGIIDDKTKPFLEIRANDRIPVNPNAGTSIIDPNGTALSYNYDVPVYPGYKIDVKSQMGGETERTFIIRATGRKNIGTAENPNIIPIEDSAVVSVIIRDMFELN